MVLNTLYIIVGFALLIKGGDYLVDGSVQIARRAKLSPMVIVLTVIGFGTSAPELIVSTMAAIDGSSGIAIGNVVGSNIANIALILGASAVIVPLTVSKFTVAVDAPFMVAAAILLPVVGMTGTISRWHGLVGVLILTAYIAWQIRRSRSQDSAQPRLGAANSQESDAPTMNFWKALLMVVGAIAALGAGAKLLIVGASDIAMMLGMAMGISAQEMERIIGLTIVAVGTSFPELFASVIAASKGQVDMAIGNIIGSVTFNIYCVIGVAAMCCPIHNADVGFAFDYAVMAALAVLLWGGLRTRYTLERWEGWTLLTLYIIYILFTIYY